MDVDKDQILSKFRGNAPASAAEIEQVEADVGFRLPADYGSFLRHVNGGEGFIGPNAYIIFWKLGELAEMNRAYQVPEFAPGLFIFGSDGGGEAYAFDVRTSAMPIVSVPFVGMDLSLVRVIAATFNDFLEVLSKT
jgi:hypothetical protein